MIRIRKSKERGHANHGWLETYHTFSFADYYDPRHMHFQSLRVINEDFVAPGQGFPPHSHQDMEILTYILKGQIEHQDSMGNHSIIQPGEIQRMTAGRGVTHSEFNPSQSEPLHLLQIWILPEKKGLDPGYEQKNFLGNGKEDLFQLLASRTGEADSITIHQDVKVYTAKISERKNLTFNLKDNRHAWIQVFQGKIAVQEQPLEAGDGAAISKETGISLTGLSKAPAGILLFDLA